MSGIRFSPFSTAQQPQQQVPVMKVPPKPKQYTVKNSLSGSDTDVSTSNENLSKEERFVLKHTARVEPQGQEKLEDGKVTPTNDNQGRLVENQQLRFSNTSTDSTKYATPTSQRSVSEARNTNPHDSNRSSLVASNSNRNSLKDSNSNRSSMDVSQSSYNTLIIHNDDYAEYSSPPFYGKKERPRSYGERQDIEEYLNQSQVLKHLAKDVKLPRGVESRDSGVSDNEPPRYSNEEGASGTDDSAKLKSKSQPDLTNLTETEYEDIEAIIKENAMLKQQITLMYTKVNRTQKLEQEIANIHREYEAMVASNDRREKLELTARTRLQSEILRLQEINRVLRDQNEALQSQLLSHPDLSLNRNQQEALLQLAAQNKELVDTNKRQCIEIQAQNVTLEDQRAHINFLDAALKRLQDENRQKQIYVDRCAQLQQRLTSFKDARETREAYEKKLLLNSFEKDGNGNSPTANAEADWQFRDQILKIESEMKIKEDDRKINDQEERFLSKPKAEKIRYLDELYATNCKVDDLQNQVKLFEKRLAEKDAMIRTLQAQKVYGGNSFGSYNLSSDSGGINMMGYNSQTSFDASNNSFDASNPTASLLDPTNYGPNSSSASISTTYTPGYGQTNPTYNQSAINLQTINYTPVTPRPAKYSSNFSQSSKTSDPIYSSFDARNIDEQLKQLDEALLSKVSEMKLLHSSIESKKRKLKLGKGQSSIDITVGGNTSPATSISSASSNSTTISATSMNKGKVFSSSCKNVSAEETFY